MITVTYYLNSRRDSKDTDTLPINCRVRYAVNEKTETLQFSTGQRCAKKSFKGQRVRPQALFASQTNTALDEIRRRAEEVYRESLERGQMPSKAEFRDLILGKVYAVTETKDILADFPDFLIYQTEKGTAKTTLQQFKSLCEKLRDFRDKNRFPLIYENIDLAFYGKFVAHLKGKDFKPNTVGRHIRQLKIFLNWGRAVGRNPSEKFRHSEFKVLAERVENVYLAQSELDALAAVDLRRREGLENVRNWFLLACEIGLRHSDWPQVRRENVRQVPGGYDLIFTPKKTRKSSGVTVTVPLSKEAVRILTRYGFEMPKTISNQKTNKYLKEVSELAGLQKEVGTHTARRTFATLRYFEGHPVQAIMKLTGHKSENEFYKYLCVDGTENAQVFRRTDPRYIIPQNDAMDSKLKVA